MPSHIFKPHVNLPVGMQASVWAFNMASWSWEHTSNGAKIEAHVAGDTPVTFCPPGAPVNQALAAPPQPVSGAQEAPRRARGRAGHPGAAVGAPRGAGFAGCGGLVAQKGMLRELAVLPLRFPGAFKRLGAHAIDGVLLKVDFEARKTGEFFDDMQPSSPYPDCIDTYILMY